MANDFQEFLTIAKELNGIKITPLLIGSLGLEFLTDKDWQSKDIDIHVPGDARGWSVPVEKQIYNWKSIQLVMKKLDYKLINTHEHKFSKKNLLVEYGVLDTLTNFAEVRLVDLQNQTVQGVNFLIPTLSDYLKIYLASSKDSYRADHNNHKDFAKIAYLNKACKPQ
ncbi:phosphoribosylanthranilate isomerase [Xylocopilactobacillus apis]|uniref:Phosphoribosylanthranilate isomerase n=1 Tax=Xylocopilactobacillus apis TaxID=2932183 RepID=A0AAU9DM69_9LACO|nr:phosphoribosylanthranilate isomerase [Xylocopilactobacillus apis]BDR55958.1 hypothetical protein KIMC2_05200 [Xylocopilactobacillus apis]